MPTGDLPTFANGVVTATHPGMFHRHACRLTCGKPFPSAGIPVITPVANRVRLLGCFSRWAHAPIGLPASAPDRGIGLDDASQCSRSVVPFPSLDGSLEISATPNTGYVSAATLKLLEIEAEANRGAVLEAPAITTDVVETLKRKLQLTDSEVARFVGVPERTYRRYRASGDALPPSSADSVLRAARILHEANRTFADEDKALRWLKSEHPILGAKPIDLMDSDAGSRAVGDELVRIQLGDLA